MPTRLLLAALVAASACKIKDPLYCDQDTPCTDSDRPFCDLNGEYPGSEGIKRTCIADPFASDAGPDGDADGSTERTVVSLATADTMSCAIFNDGGLRCWGTGPLGYVSAEPIGDDEFPATAGDVPTGGPVRQIAIGSGHACALYETGDLRCWGGNSKGELGYGNTDPLGGSGQTPDLLPNVPVGGKVNQVTAGDRFTCALIDNGDVRCWGYAFVGQLGYGDQNDIGDTEIPSSQDPVPLGAKALGITSGYAHSCAVLEGGLVRCWGLGNSGRLGYGAGGTVGDNETPASRSPVNVGGTVKHIVAGREHTCAIQENNDVRCWGSCFALGYPSGGTCTDNIGDDEAPASAGPVETGGAARSIAIGDSFSCALLEDESLRCWGSPGSRLGYGLGNVEAIGDDETPAEAGELPIGGSVEFLSSQGVNRNHTCAVLSTGAVRCWGESAGGRLGYPNRDDVGDDEPAADAGDVHLLD
jgi:alpha-tubulin suppressor-like RCC1 family protein